MVRSHRQLTVPAVDENDQAYGGGPTQPDQSVEPGPGGPSGVQHIVDQNHRRSGDGERKGGGDAAVRYRPVVPMVADVERTCGRLNAGQFGYVLSDALGEGYTASRDTDEHPLSNGMSFDQFVRNTA